MYVPVVHLPPGAELEIADVAFGAEPEPIMNQGGCFLISNRLEICESTSFRALEIMRQEEDAQSLSFGTARFGPGELRRLVGRALCGEPDALDYALKAVTAGAGASSGHSAGSHHGSTSGGLP